MTGREEKKHTRAPRRRVYCTYISQTHHYLSSRSYYGYNIESGKMCLDETSFCKIGYKLVTGVLKYLQGHMKKQGYGRWENFEINPLKINYLKFIYF